MEKKPSKHNKAKEDINIRKGRSESSQNIAQNVNGVYTSSITIPFEAPIGQYKAGFRKLVPSLPDSKRGNADRNLVAKEEIKQITSLENRRLISSRRKANPTLGCKLVQSIRDVHANLSKIEEFEIEDMKNQKRFGKLT